MKINQFLEKFKDQFTDLENVNINTETDFRNIDSWDSLTALSILLMIKEDYNTEVTDLELKNCQTVEDIYKIILSKK
jgi:acyl carrier protein